MKFFKMKILWFTNTPCEATEYLTGNRVKSGGWLLALSRALKQQPDIELHIAFFWGNKLNAFQYLDITYHPIWREGDYSKLGRYINRLKGQFSDAQDSEETQAFQQVILSVSPDIIHIHGSEESFGLIACDKKLEMPIVLSIQGLLSAYRLKYYSGITKSQVEANEPLFRKLFLDGIQSKYRNFSRRAEREKCIFKSLKYVIGRTDWDKRCAMALNPDINYFIVNEILREEFLNAEWRQCLDGQTFTMVSTISSGIYKGLEIVYQTAKRLKEINFKFTWKIIGLSPGDEMVRITENLCKISADTINIQLLGCKQADEMVNIMQQSDLYVQVSHIENSPNSLCEAMALGMPIIASIAGGTHSMLTNGKEGILIQDGNYLELVGAIIESNANYTDMVTKGKNARMRALNRHNPQNVVKELIQVYNALIL